MSRLFGQCCKCVSSFKANALYKKQQKGLLGEVGAGERGQGVT